MKKYLLISFGVHIFILLLLIIFNANLSQAEQRSIVAWAEESRHCESKARTKQIKNNDISHLRQSNPVPTHSSSNHVLSPSESALDYFVASAPHNDNSKFNQHNNANLKSEQNSANSQKKPDHVDHQYSSQLALLLHDLIQAQIKHTSAFSKVYGKRAVYLSFTLFPDGHIEDEKILQSSGVAFLDHAALEGVATLPKITAAQELLQYPEEFKVQIEFLATR